MACIIKKAVAVHLCQHSFSTEGNRSPRKCLLENNNIILSLYTVLFLNSFMHQHIYIYILEQEIYFNTHCFHLQMPGPSFWGDGPQNSVIGHCYFLISPFQLIHNCAFQNVHVQHIIISRWYHACMHAYIHIHRSLYINYYTNMSQNH